MFFFTFNESSGDQSVQGQNKLYKSLLAAFCAPCHLGMTWDTAGRTESVVSQSASVAAAHLCFHQCGTSLSSSGRVHETSREILCSSYCVAFHPAQLEGEEEEKKNRNSGLHPPSLHPHPPPLLPHSFHMLQNVSEVVTGLKGAVQRK